MYGGGAITPDVIVRPDTLTAVEQRLFQALAPKSQIFAATLADYARELKPRVRPGFAVDSTWRTELYQRLTTAGISVDPQLWQAGGSEMDRILRNRVATIAFGDSTAKRMALDEDRQLARALELLKQGRNQADLFAIAQQIAAAERNGRNRP